MYCGQTGPAQLTILGYRTQPISFHPCCHPKIHFNAMLQKYKYCVYHPGKIQNTLEVGIADKLVYLASGTIPPSLAPGLTLPSFLRLAKPSFQTEIGGYKYTCTSNICTLYIYNDSQIYINSPSLPNIGIT